MLICDTSGLLAAFDVSQSDSRTAAIALEESQPPRVVSPYVVAELDYLLRRHLNGRAAREALARLSGGAYELACLDPLDLRRALEIDRTYADLGLGVTDASLVVLAARYDTRDLLTLDERHFRKVTPIQGDAFRLLPLDTHR